MKKHLTILMLASAFWFLFSCDPANFTEVPRSKYVSADPAGNSRGGDYSEDANAGVNNGNNQATPGGDTAREISEADIIKVSGDVLYALSAYRGLMVVDISNPSALRVLGRAPVYGVPFEMYVEEGVAYVIFSSFWTFAWDEDTNTGSWSANSKLVTLDVSDPADVRTLGQFDLFGAISDSRKVGDIIYLVAYEDGYCWGCGSGARTTVTSLYAGAAEDIAQIDQISFEDGNGYSWGPRSIHVNTERLYIGGPNWEQTGSEVQVVDISDPSGVMDEGARIPIAGAIDSRWQMDEYEGMFRVISQPGWSSVAPTVETFRVVDAGHFTPLGHLQMTLPTPESLQSVRFDGDRAYAVTFERTDPLFTIDLSDPAHPLQRGELEIPGWLEYMEPRGDRMIALGYDFGAEETLTLSLFDVADLDHPVMLARVNFGGGWSWMVEDEDRIHKALRILDDRGLILMPYAGWGDYEYESGIQIFSFTRDTLTRRASAPHYGFARRAFVHRDRLFAMSDERIETFDISSVDAPVKLDTLKLARAVFNLATFGDGYVAEIVQDWWAHTARLDILTVDDPDAMAPVGSLDLASLIYPYEHPYYYWWNIFNFGRTRIFANGDYLYLIWGENYWYWDYYASEDGDVVPEEERFPTRLAVFDVSDPEAPELVSLTGLPYDMPWQRGHWSWWYTVEAGDNVVQIGSAIVVKRDTWDYWWWYDGGQGAQVTPELYVVDVSVPEAPVVSYTLDRVEGVHYGALLTRGHDVVTSYYQPEPGATDGSVAFFMHRLDVSDPANPVWEAPLNIPGSLVEFNPSTNRIVSVDYQARTAHADTWEDCYAVSTWYSWFDDAADVCHYMERSVNISLYDGASAVLQRTHTFDGWIRNVRTTGSRVFIDEQMSYYWWYYDDGSGQENPDVRPLLHVIPLNSANYDIADSVRMPSPYAYLVEAFGNHAMVVSDTPPTLIIYNAANPANVQTRGETLLTGYSYDLEFVDGRVVSANSMWGVQTIVP